MISYIFHEALLLLLVWVQTRHAIRGLMKADVRLLYISSRLMTVGHDGTWGY